MDEYDITDFLNELTSLTDEIPTRDEDEDFILGLLAPPTKKSRYFEYNDQESCLANMKRATQHHRYKKQGFSFVSHHHRLAVDEYSEHLASSLYTKCMRSGNNHFVTGESVYNPRKRKWEQGRVKDDAEDVDEDTDTLRFDRPPPSKITKTCAIVNTVDKIKVMTGPYNDTLMSKVNCVNSLEGVETHERKRKGSDVKVTSAFLLQKTKFGPVPSTRVTYKRADYTANPNTFSVLDKPNNSNINGTRGTHEFVLVNRINETYTVCSNPHGDIQTSLLRECENNNSLTVDSMVNSIVNMSFKAKACKKTDEESEEGRFVLIQKAEYGTHKTTITPGSHKREDIEMEKVDHTHTEDRKNILHAIKSREVQVHAHCINCSALGGYQIIGAIKEIAAKVLEDNSIVTSLAANNAKAMLVCASNSLMWSHVNTMIDVFTWKYRVHQYPVEKQMEFYMHVLFPLLQKMFVSRYNYAQAGIFCHSVCKSTPLFSTHDYKLVTPKFKTMKKTHIFQKVKPIEDDAMNLNRRWNSKRPLAMSKTLHSPKSKSGKVSCEFATQPARGQSIPDLWYHGAIRSRSFITRVLGEPVGNEK